MIKKRSILTIAVILILLLLLTACGGNDDSKTPSEGSGPSNNGSIDDVKDDEKKEEVTVEEQVILDENDIKITLKSIEYSGIFGPSLQLLIENNSSDSVTIQTRSSSVNDVMIETLFSSDLMPGKKANDEIIFMESTLKHAEITTIKDIEFIFHVFNSENWNEIFDSEVIKIKTSANDSYVQKYDDSGQEVMDEKDIRIIMKRVNTSDSFWGADVYVYIENNSNKNITVQARDVSINGFMIDPIFSSDVVSGKKSFDTITFFEEDLEKNNIESIDDMEISFHIFESDGWDTIYDSEMTTIRFE